MNTKLFNDRLSLGDSCDFGKKTTLWRKTEILIGHGIIPNPCGKGNTLEEIYHTETNMVPIGGCQFAMEQIFGVKGPITIPTLYTEMGIGAPNQTFEGLDIDTPTGKITMPNPLGYRVQCFGIGITGNAENNITQYPVDYREKSIEMKKQAEDGTSLDGIMVPFRYTSQDLSLAEQKKYFGKKSESPYTGYYLKAFESEPEIIHLWKAGEDETGDSQVTNEDTWDLTNKKTCETYTENVLKISEEDLKDWFNAKGRLDTVRFNTIALYEAYYNAAKGDYSNVRLFSKLTIPTENMALAKELDILYRVYSS